MYIRIMYTWITKPMYITHYTNLQCTRRYYTVGYVLIIKIMYTCITSHVHSSFIQVTMYMMIQFGYDKYIFRLRHFVYTFPVDKFFLIHVYNLTFHFSNSLICILVLMYLTMLQAIIVSNPRNSRANFM